MRLFSAFIFLLTLPVMAADPATSTAPAEKPALVVEASAPAAAHAGDKITITVQVRNTTDAALTIDIPSMWWAQSSSALVSFPKWPARGGVGPVMIFQSQTIEAGKAYTRTWEATVSADAVAGDGTFKIGVPLKRGGGTVWSNDVKLTIEK